MMKFQTKFSKLVFREKFEHSIQTFLRKHINNYHKQEAKHRKENFIDIVAMICTKQQVRDNSTIKILNSPLH